MDRINKAIFESLKQPEDESLLDAIVKIGQPAYHRLVSCLYPLPGDSHPQTVDDRMTALVERIARRDRNIITNNITHKDRFARHRVVSAAADDPQFADIIIDRLNDRSYSVLDVVLWAIGNRDYLRTDLAVGSLRKLLLSKRSDHLTMKKIDIEKLANRIEKECRTKLRRIRKG